MADKTDIIFHDNGDIITFKARTEDARAWVEENMDSPVYTSNGLIVIAEDAKDALVESMRDDGLTVIEEIEGD